MRSLLAALLNKWKTKRTREPMPPKSASMPAAALYLEQLEDRTVPATAIWQGTGDGSSWSDPHNWSTNAVPGSADDVVINSTPATTIQYSSGRRPSGASATTGVSGSPAGC